MRHNVNFAKCISFRLKILCKCVGYGKFDTLFTCIAVNNVIHYSNKKTKSKMICKNRGCGQEYIEGPECVFHSGLPVFHEGLKGWSCCAKRTTDFNAFLAIKGCAAGKHTLEDQRPQPVNGAAISSPVKVPQGVPVTTKDQSMTVDPIIIAPVVNDQIKAAKTTANSQMNVAKTVVNGQINDAKPTKNEIELFDPVDPAPNITSGTLCRRKGCGYKYASSSDAALVQKCMFHTGAPVFHDAGKGWSCCKKRVYDFDEFMKMKGCTESVHRFIDQK